MHAELFGPQITQIDADQGSRIQTPAWPLYQRLSASISGLPLRTCCPWFRVFRVFRGSPSFLPGTRTILSAPRARLAAGGQDCPRPRGRSISAAMTGNRGKITARLLAQSCFCPQITQMDADKESWIFWAPAGGNFRASPTSFQGKLGAGVKGQNTYGTPPATTICVNLRDLWAKLRAERITGRSRPQITQMHADQGRGGVGGRPSQSVWAKEWRQRNAAGAGVG